MSRTHDLLDIPTVKSVSLRKNETVGVVYDELTGIEFDVRRADTRLPLWYASDDNGRKHYGCTLPAAVKRAIAYNAANQKGE